jgi:hypothetical protein
MEVKPFQISALERYANSDVIKKIYPMVDHIDIKFNVGAKNFIYVKIFLNDPTIHSGNIYTKGMDHHYLTDHHLKNFFPYIGIPHTIRIASNVFGPDRRLVA